MVVRHGAQTGRVYTSIITIGLRVADGGQAVLNTLHFTPTLRAIISELGGIAGNEFSWEPIECHNNLHRQVSSFSTISGSIAWYTVSHLSGSIHRGNGCMIISSSPRHMSSQTPNHR